MNNSIITRIYLQQPQANIINVPIEYLDRYCLFFVRLSVRLFFAFGKSHLPSFCSILSLKFN